MMIEISTDKVLGKTYRLIKDTYFVVDFEDTSLFTEVAIDTYKVQVKFLWFWITIKEFSQYIYDEEEEFCELEAKELYHKIVNPYGEF